MDIQDEQPDSPVAFNVRDPAFMEQHKSEIEVEKKVIDYMNVLPAELLATISHELRTPLASIKGYTDTLLRQDERISREERVEFLAAIQQASNRLELIIDRMLELSHLETGAIEITSSAVDAVHVVQEAITDTRQRITGQIPGSLTVDLHIKDNAGRLTHEEPLIKADARRLREILDHLLENAINYSPNGGAIDVILRPAPNGLVSGIRSETTKMSRSASLPGHMLEICVCDHGVGIPPDHLERIFDRFHRVDTRLTRETSGVGLGLTICKLLVELHEGVIWAESCPAGGSAFHVWLPMEEEKDPVALI
jgi:signal transduction histidine kinase